MTLAARAARGAPKWSACLAALVAAALTGCVPATGAGEAVGKEGKVVFDAETNLAFSTRLVVGSAFVVGFKARSDEDKGAVAKALLESSDDKVLTVDAGGRVEITGPGAAELQVNGPDGTVDSIDIHAGKAGATTLVDPVLLAAAPEVDARLPDAFAIHKDLDTGLEVSALDTCGGELLDLHASSLEVGGATSTAAAAGPASFVVHAVDAGDVTLTLHTPGLDDLAYTVHSIDPAQVDEVDVAVTSADDQGNVTLWGRAFENDVELIGDLNFSWSSDERVTLNGLQGMVVDGSVSFPADGEPPDDRPAEVSAEVFGETGTLDLLQAGLTTTTSRGDPARVLDDASSGAGGGCGGSSAPCDPEAALVAVLGLRGLVRLRRHAAAPRRGGQGSLPRGGRPA